jgi:hypothetical protein
MIEHKFKVGQVVRMRRGLNEAARSDAYKVTRLLPSSDAGNQYRLQAVRGGQERVVQESEIMRSDN